jgi:polyribonucleotide nucleotidyltransferase
MFKEHELEFEFAGKTIKVSTGKYARQATSSVIITCGETVLMVNVTASEEPREGIDFFPLMVDFEEKLYAVGRIPGSYGRREGKASDKAVLYSRLIDRPFRPLFKEGYKNDVQINVMTLSVDDTVPPDVLGMIGAGFAVELAGLPYDGPVGSVRIFLDENGKFGINPSEAEQLASDLDLVVAGTKDSIMMVEAGCKFVEDSKVIDAIEFGHKYIAELITHMEKFAQMVGVTKIEFTPPEENKALAKIIEENAKEDLEKSMINATKASRRELVSAAKEKVKAALEILGEDHELNVYLAKDKNAFGEAMKKFEKKLLRAQIKNKEIRADGRKPTEVRPLAIETGKLPRVHGDGLFTRGDTQVLSIAALGTERMARGLDGIDSETEKFYMHNYNFPSWSVGEVKPNRGPGRREIGHGALAERAIEPALPSRKDFPYAIRVVSEVLSSSGSTSMAATCGSSLALFDAGVPMKCAVAGVAMGLIQEPDKTVVLTDIHELEDFLGDMDFKVAGDKDGISALQMDIKVRGIPMKTIRAAIEQAKAGRLHMLEAMNAVMPKPRDGLRGNAPRVTQVMIPTDKIGAVIGPGGKNIKMIIEKTGADLDINDDGTVNIYSTSDEAAQMAKEYVEIGANGVKNGQVYDGEVVKVLDGVGAIVEMIAGASGLVHISQIAVERVDDVNAYVKVGDKVKVRVQGTDFKGRTSLSIKEVDHPPTEEEVKAREEKAKSGGDRDRGDRDRGGRGGDRRGGGRDNRDRGSRDRKEEANA